MITNDFRTTSGSRSGADDVTATREASATRRTWWGSPLCLGSVEDELSADRRDNREHQRPAQRGGLHRSASVPARHDGALQRLKAPSLSALRGPLLDRSVDGVDDLEAARDLAAGARLAHDQQARRRRARSRPPRRSRRLSGSVVAGVSVSIVQAPSPPRRSTQSSVQAASGCTARSRRCPTAPSAARSARRRRRCSARRAVARLAARRRLDDAHAGLARRARRERDVDGALAGRLLCGALGRPARRGHAHRDLVVEVEVLGREHAAVGERQLADGRRLGARGRLERCRGGPRRTPARPAPRRAAGARAAEQRPAAAPRSTG